jgi:hypothetical protein
MGLFDALKVRLPSLPSAGREFYKVLTEDDFMSANATVYSGKWNKIGTFTVPAQNIYRFGYGSPNQPENQGYLYIYLKDPAGNEVTGKVRLAVADYNERVTTVVFEDRADVLHGDTSDRSKMKPLPDTGVKATEDMKLIIYLNPDSNSTVSYTQTVMTIPTTNTQL